MSQPLRSQNTDESSVVPLQVFKVGLGFELSVAGQPVGLPLQEFEADDPFSRLLRLLVDHVKDRIVSAVPEIAAALDHVLPSLF